MVVCCTHGAWGPWGGKACLFHHAMVSSQCCPPMCYAGMEGQGPGPQFGESKVQNLRGDYVKVPFFFCPLGNAWTVPAVVFWQLTMAGGPLTF